MKRVKVQYYAVFRERRGLSEEQIETCADTAEQLYEELATKHALGLPKEIVRASINLSFKPLKSPIVEGDTVVFIPPVAGG